MALSGKALRVEVATTVRDVRRALGWSQRELARRADVDQSTICRIEQASLDDLTFDTAARVLDALGVRTALDLRAPFIADRHRQADSGHAKCVAYVARRLRRLGWLVLTEVEIATGAARGWIDVLAYRSSDGMLLVVEVKTELGDIGMVQRQVTWYERAAWDAARRVGWRPRRAITGLVVLATDMTLERITDNRELLRSSFAVPARDLGIFVAGDGVPVAGKRSLALIDPYNRSKNWLLPTPLSGRVARPRYADYAALMRRVRAA